MSDMKAHRGRISNLIEHGYLKLDRGLLLKQPHDAAVSPVEYHQLCMSGGKPQSALRHNCIP